MRFVEISKTKYLFGSLHRFFHGLARLSHEIRAINQIVMHVLVAVFSARHAAVPVKHAKEAALVAVIDVRVPIQCRLGNNLKRACAMNDGNEKKNREKIE